MKIRFKLAPGAKAPTKATKGAAGWDLYATNSLQWVVRPRQVVAIDTGVSIELPEGYEAQVRPRSSLSRDGLQGAFGTIDSDYRGRIKVLLFNTSDVDLYFDPGDRIAQLVIQKVEDVEWEEAEELSETVRGAGGFGSTGR